MNFTQALASASLLSPLAICWSTLYSAKGEALPEPAISWGAPIKATLYGGNRSPWNRSTGDLTR